MAIITPPPRPVEDKTLLGALRQESDGWTQGATKARSEGKFLDAITCNQTANLCDRSVSMIETLMKYNQELERVISLQNEQSALVRLTLIEYLRAELERMANRMKTDGSEGLAGEALGLKFAFDSIMNDTHLKKDA